jgi:hypothetical protein
VPGNFENKKSFSLFPDKQYYLSHSGDSWLKSVVITQCTEEEEKKFRDEKRGRS